MFYSFLKISTGFIRDVRRPMKKLARAPAMSDKARAATLRLAEMLTGSLTAVVVAVAASLAKAGVRLISQGVDTGMERKPKR
jgi:hypothetical protein